MGLGGGRVLSGGRHFWSVRVVQCCHIFIGVAQEGSPIGQPTCTSYIGQSGTSSIGLHSDGSLYHQDFKTNNSVRVLSGQAFDYNQVGVRVGVLLDVDESTLEFFRDGSPQLKIAIPPANYFPAFSLAGGSSRPCSIEVDVTSGLPQ